MSLPKSGNPVVLLFKKHKTVHAVYEILKQRLATVGALRMEEWDWFEKTQAQLEPNIYQERQAATLRRLRLRAAHDLSIEDLESVIRDKKAEKT